MRTGLFGNKFMTGGRFSRPGFGRGPFSASIGGQFARLGQTGLEWYNRAKLAMKIFEGLIGRTDRIANKTAREAILEWLGSPTVQDTPANRYAAVAGDVVYDVEAFTPPNYNAYQLERRQNRVEGLEAVDEDFQEKVAAAEKEFGLLPAPTVERIEVPVPVRIPASAPEKMDLTVPIVAGAAAVALAILLG